MSEIKMVAIDLDGTLLRSDGTVSDYTLQTLKKARDKGVIVAIATGRMYQAARRYGEMLQLGDSPLLLFAGGLIETLETKKILFQQTISLADTTKAVRLARKYHWQMQTYIDDELGVYEHDAWAKDYERITGCKAVALGEAFYTPKGPSNKLLSRGGHEDLLTRKPILEKAMPGKFTIVFSGPTFMEIMPKGVDKGIGIQRLGGLYHIPVEQIMSLGDSQNDLAMLKAAGFSVAMGNASEEIKQAAHAVTASNNEDGVARAIEKYVL